jgi:Tol biopolymer transport system component
VGQPANYNTVALSPDGTRVVVSRADATSSSDLWIYEFARGTSTRLTVDPANDWIGTWSPDGSQIIFSSSRTGGQDLYRTGSDGAGRDEALLTNPHADYPQDWSRDGRFLLFSRSGAATSGTLLDLAVLDLQGGMKERWYIKTEFLESQGRFSPDGRFVAYTSNASGQNEIYVQTFPNPEDGKWMISRAGGGQPRWRRDGRELFFISLDSKLMAVEVSANAVFSPGVPKELFDAPIWGGGQTNNATRYDVSADGKRFLINAAPVEARGAPITVVLNWEGILKQ